VFAELNNKYKNIFNYLRVNIKVKFNIFKDFLSNITIKSFNINRI